MHRYARGDPVEAWLHELLCLDASDHIPAVPSRLPHPSECELYMVERDTLFSYHKVVLSTCNCGSACRCAGRQLSMFAWV